MMVLTGQFAPLAKLLGDKSWYPNSGLYLEDLEGKSKRHRTVDVAEAAAPAIEYAMGYMQTTNQCRIKEDDE